MRRNHRTLHDVFKARQLGHGLKLRTTEYLVRSSIGNQLACLQHHHAVAQRVYLLALVRDVENRNGVAVIPPPQVVEDTTLCDGIERSQRFVQQQRARTRHQRPRQCDPLALSPPEISDGRRSKSAAMPNDSAISADRASRSAGVQRRQSVFDVLPDRHVRKQGQRLKQIADVTVARRKIDSLLRVEQRCACPLRYDPSPVSAVRRCSPEWSSCPRPTGRTES